MLAVSLMCWILGLYSSHQGPHSRVPTRTLVRGAVAPCCIRMFGVDSGNFDTAGDVEAQMLLQATNVSSASLQGA